MTELKNCPFCGGKAEFTRTVERINGHYTDVVFVFCTECNAMTNHVAFDAKVHPHDEEYEIAKAAWNKRV